MTYYQRICKLCERKRITLNDLSEQTGITLRRLKHWNRYHIYPKQELLDKIAEVLHVAPELLDYDMAD